MEIYFDSVRTSGERYDTKLPPPPKVWEGDVSALFIGGPELPWGIWDLRKRWGEDGLPDIVPRLVHWVSRRGAPLLPNELVHPAYEEFCDMGLDGTFAETRNDNDTISMSGLEPATRKVQNALKDQAALFTRLREAQSGVNDPESSDSALLQLGAHMRQLRGLLREFLGRQPILTSGVLLFTTRYLTIQAQNGETPPQCAPWKGPSVLADWRADPADQTDIMDSGRLSGYVPQLIMHVNEHGLPELPEAVRKADEVVKGVTACLEEGQSGH